MMDKEKLEEVFKSHTIGAVMHFAGLKSVTESIAKPMAYYDINLGSKNTHQNVYKYFSSIELLPYISNLIF